MWSSWAVCMLRPAKPQTLCASTGKSFWSEGHARKIPKQNGHTENWGHVSSPRVSHPPDHSSAGSTRLEGKRSGSSVLFISTNESHTARTVSICARHGRPYRFICAKSINGSKRDRICHRCRRNNRERAKDRQVQVSKSGPLQTAPLRLSRRRNTSPFRFD
ncbi:unnamed protein product [Chondrus crispus]|uniref:Uncharacterized protein n=1 Tax=Chondrus crispus TaxID=2769 RepID=R7QNK0_CHOCR|nr:unnamed protein product [Chondrus crispus]CDF40072.1 unnamed protein product [Chondrus crispus]|eukprot:XP_005710366.1 unnamed protein product [Chondrus crispus]